MFNIKTIQKAIVFCAVIALCTAQNIFAQSYTNRPNDTISVVGVMEDLHTLSIEQVNISGDTLHLKWKKIFAIVPLSWEASVCDNSFCHTSLVDSGSMIPVYPSEYGLLLLHVTPHVNYGKLVVQYAVWDSMQPTMVDTLTYMLRIDAPSEVKNHEEVNRFTIQPTLVSDELYIEGAALATMDYSLQNSEGKVLLHSVAEGNALRLNLGNFPNGLYILSLYREKIYSKNIIIQH